MKDEIKEILDMLKHHISIVSVEDEDLLLDYITKLQEENEELKKNQRYYKNGVFSLEYDKETLSDMVDDYKSRCEKAIDKIQYIIDYGFDYDGFNTVESLKGLIDMLVNYARESKNILQNGSDSK